MRRPAASVERFGETRTAVSRRYSTPLGTPSRTLRYNVSISSINELTIFDNDLENTEKSSPG